MTEDNGIVDCQRQLQYYSNRIGNKGNGTAQEVGTHVHKGSYTEGGDQYGNLRIGPGSQSKYYDDNDSGNDNDNLHFALQFGCSIGTNLRIYVGIIAGQLIFNLVNRIDTDIVCGSSVKGNIKQGRRIFVVILCVVKYGVSDAINLLQLFGKLFALLIGNVGNHDPGSTIGDKLVIHDRQSLPGLGRIRQVGCDIIFNLDPSICDNTENNGKNIKQEKQVPFINDKGCYLFHGSCLILSSLVHVKSILSCRFCFK